MYQKEPISFDFTELELPTTNLSLIDKKANNKSLIFTGIIIGISIAIIGIIVYRINMELDDDVKED